jgi:hypothetical protein
MKNTKLFLFGIYKMLKSIFFLYKISSQVGIDNVISIINLIENFVRDIRHLFFNFIFHFNKVVIFLGHIPLIVIPPLQTL